ncbi:MAG: amino acid ABC transporter permease [Oscillospiraceae bacterium]|nr:amino acid ABC transporter permease [Oscillospiraceae bacterium]
MEEGVFPGADSDNTGSSKYTLGFILSELSTGLKATLSIFFLTLLFSMPLGLLITFVRRSKIWILRWIARIYISIMRGTPLMLQLLVVFFGPFYLFKIQMPASYRFWAVIIGFTLNYAAYFAEIFRAGIDSIPAGQYEAGKILGYTNNQFFRKIVLPQMIKRVLPPVTNETVTLVKDTSLAFVLSYMEIFTIAKQVAAGSANIIPLFVAGVFYYVFNFAIAVIMEHIEKKLDYYR